MTGPTNGWFGANIIPPFHYSIIPFSHYTYR
jgi:hypothetical protein